MNNRLVETIEANSYIWDIFQEGNSIQFIGTCEGLMIAMRDIHLEDLRERIKSISLYESQEKDNK